MASKLEVLNQHNVTSLHSDAPFYQLINSIYPVSEESILYLREKTSMKSFRKGDYLHKSGQVCPQIFFIIKGILRGYRKHQNKEITTWFAHENMLASCITGFFEQIVTNENIQCVEDALVLVIDFKTLEFLYENYPEYNFVGRVLYQEYFKGAEERAFIARLTEATYKYEHFLQTHEHLLNRIPLKYIASYLGMTLETLSRIRGKISQKKGGAI